MRFPKTSFFVLTGLLILAVTLPRGGSCTVKIEREAQNFIVLFDVSGSMDQRHWARDEKKLAVARQILEEMNEDIPDLGWYAALYTFSPFKPVYELQVYDKSEFAKAIAGLPVSYKAGGAFGPASRLDEALAQLNRPLRRLCGRTVIYLFTDGRYQGRNPLEHARVLNRQYDVCFQVVNMAQDRQSMQMLESLGRLNDCSEVIDYGLLPGSPEICTGALCTRKAVKTAAETEDSDGDGVVDADDKCWGTPQTYAVNQAGCAIPVAARDYVVHFANNSALVGSEARYKLDEAGKFLADHPEATVLLAGHASPVGDEEYNLRLSEKRARNVQDYLVRKWSVMPDRITVHSYGGAMPLGPDAAKDGQAKNRRVSVTITNAYKRR
ncbi:MAG: OmpA family protein [Deltaproteobacteria bacterium]|nr:OmpA family protein [Deltaproteobacteria bacterium]